MDSIYVAYREEISNAYLIEKLEEKIPQVTLYNPKIRPPIILDLHITDGVSTLVLARLILNNILQVDLNDMTQAQIRQELRYLPAIGDSIANLDIAIR